MREVDRRTLANERCSTVPHTRCGAGRRIAKRFLRSASGNSLPRAASAGTIVSGLPIKLRKGARASIISDERVPIGVMIVPSDVTVLCAAPGRGAPF
ncbi:MAG TPA: hypothetical protein VNI54_07890 [Thermoanaerobaculia bacterium]|nr:hypothetical protein [Thermoanaerobaculia bacterium]